ncbi:MAG: hypothetical protein JWR75_1834 [Devosia sp.]|nr:hypothetical protein [Devosia sp.]
MTIRFYAAAALFALGSGAAFAVDLPAICTANAMDHEMGAMGGSAMDMGNATHPELMDGMNTMNADMMAGSSASDFDVAFVCAMLPHHQGAIDMATAELKNGDDPWAKELAQQIITAQEAEVAAMLDWLGKQ